MDRLYYVSDSIRGTGRDENKDRVFITQENGNLLAVLFDGISSAKEANRGIDVAISFIERNHHKINSNLGYNLDDLMFGVNKEILESGLSSPFTTYSALYVPKEGHRAIFSNLGDSRIYEITPQSAKQLSIDDNLAHNKNVVTKYLGMVELDRSQFKNLTLEIEGRRILLCSDGFYTLLEDNLLGFHKILNFKKQSDVKKALTREIHGKNQDDASYILTL